MLINSPDLWLPRFPWPQAKGNKYDRGHAFVVGGPAASTGATRLAAYSALHAGAGLVSVICDEESLPIYAAALTSVMTKIAIDTKDFSNLLHSSSVNGILIGPGTGVTPRTRDFVLASLDAKKSIVLDADALTIFAERPDDLFSRIQTPCILTPHEGEFRRLFPQFDATKDRVATAKAADELSNAVVILKGAETLIAAPDGRIVINTHATPFLATAGTGDVLAGLCLGLLTQGMDAFDAACAAVWIHTQIANAVGPGLISENLIDQIPLILSNLYKQT